MVGGTVVETIHTSDRVWVNCREQYGKSEKHFDECAIYVERNEKSLAIAPGDCVWWQEGWAMWTPKKNRVPEDEGGHLRCGEDYDIKIDRIGCSGVGRPEGS